MLDLWLSKWNTIRAGLLGGRRDRLRFTEFPRNAPKELAEVILELYNEWTQMRSAVATRHLLRDTSVPISHRMVELWSR